VIPKAQGFQKSLFRVNALNETGDTDVCMPRVGRAVYEHFFSGFCLYPSRRNNIEEKTYPSMKLPAYREADGANFILVED